MEHPLFGTCPFVTAQTLLAGKWTILILHYLQEDTMRFNELLRKFPQMTHATLSKQLKILEGYGLITRTEYPQIPPKVEYSLSEIGQTFQVVLESLNTFGNAYIAYQNEKAP